MRSLMNRSLMSSQRRIKTKVKGSAAVTPPPQQSYLKVFQFQSFTSLCSFVKLLGSYCVVIHTVLLLPQLIQWKRT